MKQFLLSIFLSFLCLGQMSFAASPAGNITFYNASEKNVTAKVSHFGQITIEKKEKKSVSYATLAQICSANPTKCTPTPAKANWHVSREKIITTFLVRKCLSKPL